MKGSEDTLFQAFQDCMEMGQGELYRSGEQYFFEVGLPEYTAVEVKYELIEEDFWHLVQDCLRAGEYDEDAAFEFLLKEIEQIDL